MTASYSNDSIQKIANLVLGKFTNPAGLEQIGNNMYAETTVSGTSRYGISGPELG